MFQSITTKWWDKPRFASQAVAKKNTFNTLIVPEKNLGKPPIWICLQSARSAVYMQ